MPYTSNYEEACKKIGWEKGNEEGWKKGREEGWLKGREEGRELGSIMTSHEYIMKTLQIRFGQIPPNMGESISNIQDRTVLDSMLEQAIKSNSIDEFKKNCGII